MGAVRMAASFLDEAAKTKIVHAVREVESKTSAEIVVSVRARSGDYRDVDLTAGLVAAFFVLATVIYHPAELDEDLWLFEVLLAFAIVSLLVNKVPAIKRRLLSKKRQAGQTLTEARAHFVEAGISRTRDRTGISIFVSQLERTVIVITDVGIDPAKLGQAWEALVGDLERAAARLDVEAFVQALAAMGPVLGAVYPRRDDDDNELPDAPMLEAR